MEDAEDDLDVTNQVSLIPETEHVDPSETCLQKSVKKGGRYENPWPTFSSVSPKVLCHFLCCMPCVTRQRGPWPTKQAR